MSVEKPVSQPNKSKLKLDIPISADFHEKEAEKLIDLSVKTAVASAKVAQDSTVNNVNSADIQNLAGQVAQDLRANGVSVTSENERSVTQATRLAFTESTKPTPDPEKMKLPTPGEINTTLKYLHESYGLDRYKKQLTLAGSAFVGLELLQAAAGYFYNGIANKLTENKDLFRNITEIIAEAQTGNTPDRAKSRKFALRALGKTIDIWGPLLFQFTARAIEQPALKQFDKFLKGVGDTVNKRVSDSLFMSDYALLYDKNPAEILDIVERGKAATVDLLRTVYGDLIPDATALLISGLPNYQIDKKYMSGLILGYARLPFLFASTSRTLDARMKDRFRLIQEQERLESRIAGTITNLETAQVSGKTEEGAKELTHEMQEREALISGERQSKIKQRGIERITDLLFDNVAPLAIAGLDLMAGLKSARINTVPERQTTFGDISDIWKPYLGTTSLVDPQAATLAGASAYLKLGQYKYAQQDNKYLVSRLMSSYAGNIVQDLQDIHEMDKLLGPWNELDRPDGQKEKARKPVSTLSNLGISIKNLNVMGILHDVSFDIGQGEFVAIRADKGEGKTTLLRTMLGLYKPDSGVVAYGGTDIDGIKKFGSESLHRQFGYAPQNSGFIDTLSLKENLLLWNKDIPDSKITKTMQELGLEKLVPRLEEQGNKFSGGEKRLLTIVRALLTNPKILYLDEPTANLDEASINRLVFTLQTIRKNHPETTIITVTHDADFAKYTDRTINLAEFNKRPERSQTPELNDHQVLEAIAKPQ